MEHVALFTGYALLAIVGVLGAVAAHRSADRAQHEASRLQQARGRLVALEHAAEALDSKLRKLAGRVYAGERPSKVIEGETVDESTLSTEEKNRLIRDRLRAQHGLRANIAKSNGAEE